MTSFLPYLHLIETRAETLAALVAIGFIFGEFLARGPFTQSLRAGNAIIRRLMHKLNRENRSVATLVYRGIVALLMLLAPAIIAAGLLGRAIPWLEWLVALLLITWFGHCFQTITTLRRIARAKTDGLALELPQLDYLFSDSHAVIRHLITARFHAFAIGVVGGCFWYMAGGLIAMAIYLTLAAACRAYQPSIAFGWAARSLFMLAHAVPNLIARALMFLAAFFTPHCKPFAGLFAKRWLAALAATLAVALGGKTPEGELPWVGSGSARLTRAHLRRAMHLLAVATMLLVLLLAHQHLSNTLKIFI